MLIAVLSDIHDNIWKLDEPNYASFPKVCKARGELFSLAWQQVYCSLLMLNILRQNPRDLRPSPSFEL